jgi:hypothetical protein
MKLVGGIHIPNDIRERFGKKCEAEKACGIQIFEDLFQFAPVVIIRVFNTSSEEGNSHLDITADAG